MTREEVFTGVRECLAAALDISPDSIQEGHKIIEDLGADFNLYSENSLLWDINKAAGQDAVKIPDHMMTVLKRALLVAEFSDGAFDPTVGPSVLLWRDTMLSRRLPSIAQIDAARDLVNYKSLRLDEAAKTAKLDRPGMIIDLSAIAKGYLADQGARFLEGKGVTAATVELGGDLVTVGAKPDGSPFRIYVDNPFTPGGDPVGFVECKGVVGVVTSGSYRQFVIINSERYSHFVDPRTGRAIAGVSSCTVSGPDAMTCDALATAICVMGPERAFPLIQKMNAWYKKHPPEK